MRVGATVSIWFVVFKSSVHIAQILIARRHCQDPARTTTDQHVGSHGWAMMHAFFDQGLFWALYLIFGILEGYYLQPY